VTSALEGSGLSEPRPGRFSPGKDPVPIVQEAGWAPGPAWTSDGITVIFLGHNPIEHPVTMRSKQPPTEMSTRRIYWAVKAAVA
jgi:hypothetical protein